MNDLRMPERGRQSTGDKIEIGEALLFQAADFRADRLLMVGYGHSPPVRGRARRNEDLPMVHDLPVLMNP